MIPKRLIRTVPSVTTDRQDADWDAARLLHPDWDHIDLRDPLDPADFPLTAGHWQHCRNGAQFAGLVRLEALLRGGIYIDSDVRLFRPLDPLLPLGMFAAWEDEATVPDAVLGAEPDHPAVHACLGLAVDRLHSGSGAWRDGNGAWATGPGVTTTVLADRTDVLLLPPGSFFPVHYSQRDACEAHQPAPWTFGMHRWDGSWLEASS